jgi:hypothetical protein
LAWNHSERGIKFTFSPAIDLVFAGRGLSIFVGRANNLRTSLIEDADRILIYP